MQPECAGRVMEAVAIGFGDDASDFRRGFAWSFCSSTPLKTAVLTSAQNPTPCQNAIPAAKPAPAHRADLTAPLSRNPVRV